MNYILVLVDEIDGGWGMDDNLPVLTKRKKTQSSEMSDKGPYTDVEVQQSTQQKWNRLCFPLYIFYL